MSERKLRAKKIRLVISGKPVTNSGSFLSAVRGASATDPSNGIVTEASFDLSPNSQGAKPTLHEVNHDDVLALEMEDGFIYFTRADKLQEDLRGRNRENGD